MLWLADALPAKARAAMEDFAAPHDARRNLGGGGGGQPLFRLAGALGAAQDRSCAHGHRPLRHGRGSARGRHPGAALRAEAAAKLLDLLAVAPEGSGACRGRAGAPAGGRNGPSATGARFSRVIIEAEAPDASALIGLKGPKRKRRCTPPSCSPPGSRTASRPSTMAAPASTRWRSAATTSIGGRISTSSTSSTSRSCATARRCTRPFSAPAATIGRSRT